MCCLSEKIDRVYSILTLTLKYLRMPFLARIQLRVGSALIPNLDFCSRRICAALFKRLYAMQRIAVTKSVGKNIDPIFSS